MSHAVEKQVNLRIEGELYETICKYNVVCYGAILRSNGNLEFLSAIQRVFFAWSRYWSMHIWHPVCYSRVVELETHSEIFKESGMVVDSGSLSSNSYCNGSYNTIITNVN